MVCYEILCFEALFSFRVVFSLLCTMKERENLNLVKKKQIENSKSQKRNLSDILDDNIKSLHSSFSNPLNEF